MIRTVEHLAPEAIAQLIPRLTQLTTEQPTTAELEEALSASRAITRALFEWLAARYSGHAQAKTLSEDCPAVAAALMGLRQIAASRAYGIPTETAAEREELDRIERAHPQTFAPHLREIAG